MKNNIKEVGQRIRDMREICGLSVEEAAKATGTTPEQFLSAENGEYDCSVTFVYRCAEIFKVDIVELLTGENPKLKRYSVIRKGEGLPVKRRESFEYQHLSYLFKNKKIEPFLVKAPYNEAEQDKPVSLSSHDGQEFDYVLSGGMKMSIDGKIKNLTAGDAIIYDSSAPHGMIASTEGGCEFLAILIK
ncbi:MAG: helix-turn-helix domain-containing protein [Ruminococcus sp.]|jgi:DNA-binding XRE family transcriptional regulator|nr:helix-turn-helix domain-containing protein [Ruminococcus sp.]